MLGGVEADEGTVIREASRRSSSDNDSAAIGYTVEIGGSTEKEHDRIRRATCNEAEYHALIRGLEAASENGCVTVEAGGDSQLVVNQVTGDWDTNEQHLRELRDRAQEVADEFEQFEIQHIPREENWEADVLVGQAFDN